MFQECEFCGCNATIIEDWDEPRYVCDECSTPGVGKRLCQSKIAGIMVADPKVHRIPNCDDDDLWECIRVLSKLVRDAEPIVERDCQMMADLTRFAPLSPDAQKKHDQTKYPSEVWMEEFEALTDEHYREMLKREAPTREQIERYIDATKDIDHGDL